MIADIAYGEPVGRGHLLDVYPADAPGEARPLLIWTGGSGWMADNGKDTADAIAEIFNPRGFVVAGVSIRTSTQAQFPAQVHDIKAAIRFLRANAGTYGIDPQRVAVMGDSSGGWTTAMAALYDDPEGAPGIQAAVAFYPPTDFLRMDEQMVAGAAEAFNEMMDLLDCHNDGRSPESLLIGGAVQTNPEKVAAANPATYARPDAPPIMLLHGGLDPLVPHGQSVLLYEALKKSGATATFYSVPGAVHDWRTVLDPSAQAGTTKQRTDGDTEATPPTWDAIELFIRTAFDAAGTA